MICAKMNEENNVKYLWLRLGGFVSGSKEDIEKVLEGDSCTLRKLLEAGKFQVEGDTYIPESTISNYNSDNNTCFEEDNISFDLCNIDVKSNKDMNKEGNKYKSLINDIDGLIGELNIVRNHVLNNDFQTASEYTDGIVAGSEELRDKLIECIEEYSK